MHQANEKGWKERVVQQCKVGSPVAHQKMAPNFFPANKQSKTQKYSSKKQSDDARIITKELSDIFRKDPTTESSMTPRSILIEGAPGIGKTVIAKEIAYKWANGELLVSKKILLLYYIRDQHIQTATSLSDLLTVYANEDEEMISMVQKHINRNGGEDVVFLLDGLDESPAKISFLDRLVRVGNLPNAMIVVTSRPTVSRSSWEKKIEILGFAEEQQNQYIEMSLSEKNLKSKLLDHLALYPMINSLCIVPLFLAIFIYLFEMHSLPKTLTQMNKLFIIHTVCHYMGKKGETLSSHFIDIKDFPEEIYAMVHKLSQLAYDGLKQSKSVFTSAEIKSVCPEIFTQKGIPNCYGLLQGVKHPAQRGAAGHTISFKFLHSTVQEYLAAYHVSGLPHEQQLRELKSFWQDDLAFMWMMYAGISGVQSRAFQLLLQDVTSGGTVMNSKMGLHLFQCIFEGGNSDIKVPNVISGLFANDCINLQGLTLLPYHILSLTNFMAKSSIAWKLVNLENCHMGDTGMKILKRFLFNKRFEAKTSTIKQINIFGNDLPSIHGTYCSMIEKGYFQSFKMSKHKLTDNLVAEVAHAISQNRTIRALDISSNSFGIKGVEAIADYLRSNKTLESLNISYNSIGLKGAEHLASALCENTVLKELNASRCDLCDDGAAVIIKGLHGHPKLEKLDLSCNSISNKGASELAHSLDGTKGADSSTEGAAGCTQVESGIYPLASANLKELNLSHNKLTNSGAECLSFMLKFNSSLKALDISRSGLTDVGIAVICDSLLFNTTLQNLDMSGNYVTSASHVAGILEQNKFLKTLSIQQYGVKPFSFYLSILNALHKNNIVMWLGLPQCIEQSQLDEAIAELNKSRSLQNIHPITVEYYN